MQRKEELSFSGSDTPLSADLRCLQGGGAEQEAALSSLEKQLICPICLEMFTKPVVILPCQHNLCRKCANELYQPSLFQARTTMMVNSGRFRCPSCRHEVVLDRHGVYGLQRNLLVENIIDVYKQEVSNINNATSSALPPPAPAPPPAEMTCSDHEGEKVNIYCLSCRRPTCSLCKVFGSHQSCNVAPLTHVYEQQKVELNEGLASLAEFSDKIQALIAELEQSCHNVEEVYKTQKHLVCEKFDRLFSVVDERRKAMMEQITSEQEEKTGHAQALVRCYGDTIEANSKLMERAASSMDDPDSAVFVQNSRELIMKVTAAASFCPTETLTPGFENMDHYAFNFSRQKEVLQNIDFPRVEEDVPEEPEETSTQDPDVQLPEETSLQSPGLEPGPEPMTEPTKTLISSTVEPVETEEPVHMSPVAPIQLWDSEEPLLHLDCSDPDPDEWVPGQTEIQKQDIEPRRTEPDPVEDKNICQQQEGMSTLQCEGGEAEEDQDDRIRTGTRKRTRTRTNPYPAKTLQDVTTTEMMVHKAEPATDMAPCSRANAHHQTQEQAPGNLPQTTENQVEPPRNQSQTEDQSQTLPQISEDQCHTSKHHIKPHGNQFQMYKSHFEPHGEQSETEDQLQIVEYQFQLPLNQTESKNKPQILERQTEMLKNQSQIPEDQTQSPEKQPKRSKNKSVTANEAQTPENKMFPPKKKSQNPALVHRNLIGQDVVEAGELLEGESSDEAAESKEKGVELGVDTFGFDVESGLDYLDEGCDENQTNDQEVSEVVFEVMSEEEVASEEGASKDEASEEVSKDMVSEEGTSKMVSEVNSEEVVSGEVVSKEASKVTSEVVSEVVASKGVVTSEEVMSDEVTSKELPSQVTSKEVLSKVTSEEVMSEEASEEVVSKEVLSEEVMSEEASEEVVSKEVLSEEVMSEEASEEVVSKEMSNVTSEVVSEEVRSEVVACEEVASQEVTSQLILEEVMSEETSEEVTSTEPSEEVTFQASCSKLTENMECEIQEDVEGRMNSFVSLQAVTLLFYLLAFLLILQRVWGYIGCFILI